MFELRSSIAVGLCLYCQYGFIDYFTSNEIDVSMDEFHESCEQYPKKQSSQTISNYVRPIFFICRQSSRCLQIIFHFIVLFILLQ